MKTNLFAKLCLDPKLKYSFSEMKESIRENLQNLLEERNVSDHHEFNPSTLSLEEMNSKQIMSKAEVYYRNKILKYEPRLINLDLKLSTKIVNEITMLEVNILGNLRSSEETNKLLGPQVLDLELFEMSFLKEF